MADYYLAGRDKTYRARTKYITDAQLQRAGACRSVRDQLDHIFGTKTRRVPVTFDTLHVVALVLGRLSWFTDNILSWPQNTVYHNELAKRMKEERDKLPKDAVTGQPTKGVDEFTRHYVQTQAALAAYYSPVRG